MKKKKLIELAATVSLLAVIGVGSTLAYFTDNTSATNVITMGHVDITLTEETDDEDVSSKEDCGLVYKDVVPGDVLSKKPVIRVDAESEDCYLRVEITVADLDGEQTKELLSGIDIGENWKLGNDGYFYYQSVFVADKSNEDNNKLPLFTKVTIPDAWGNEVAEKTFTIKITAEAIQADNFTPETEDGTIISWGEVDIEKYKAQ